MKCQQCQEPFEEGRGHSLESDGPEQFCSYKCVEEARRGPQTPEAMLRILTEGLQTILGDSGRVIAGAIAGEAGDCDCPDCRKEREESEREAKRCQEMFGRFITEFSKPTKISPCRVLNAVARQKGVRIGDLFVWCEPSERDSNLGFSQAQNNFVCHLQNIAKTMDLYVFRPSISRSRVLEYVLQNQITGIDCGPENVKLKARYTDRLQTVLAGMEDNEAWDEKAEKSIQTTSLEFFGPRTCGYMVTEDDIDITEI